MSKLEKLRGAGTLADLAALLGFMPKGVSYVLYKIDAGKKYNTFQVPKKGGGTRTINAPERRLALLQRRLSKLLTECVADIQKTNPNYWHASHGFRRTRTIVSNAEAHKRRRFVFNVDIEDFFGSINFGRVRGFFIHDKNFKLNPAVATVIAQIACHDNALPQGSPCSPIISNLIGNIIDSRLIALARDAKCTYTRYADDLTFSTNDRLFPAKIAVNADGAEWIIGNKLDKEIKRLGFKLNPGKTRMSLRQSRQTVTGLVVNMKPNVNQDYYRAVRSMCNSLFQKGTYYRHSDQDKKPVAGTDPIEGMLSHIHFVRLRRDRKPEVNALAEKANEFNPPSAPVKLYGKFLFYKHFATPSAPLIVTEGISDIIYLKCAITARAAKFPALAEAKNGKTNKLVGFLKPSRTTRDLLSLGQGTGGQAKLVGRYSKYIERYEHRPMDHPVIILCDNDGGAAPVFNAAKNKINSEISKNTTDPFYHLGDNLYLVKVPEGDPPSDRRIENLFNPALFNTPLNGKIFNPKKEHGDESSYSKVIFAKQVIQANAAAINFAGFDELLERIALSIVDYDAKKAANNCPDQAVQLSG
ncbi:MAG: retron Ec67 family RNA-directed DNA polymerase/endonuclease [Rhodobacteraceae bacterium]|nr:retron Ec67 family RNA-directed DNA polymerase/endonuclease [Paracoccaceae bacterium]